MRTPRRWRDRSAFTLIELVAVIAILGIMSAVVGGPTLAYVDSVRSRAAAARLGGDIRYAQRTALNSGLRTWIDFDAGADSYQLYLEDPDNPGEANRLAMTHPLDQSTDPVQFGTGPFLNVSITSVDINSTDELEFDSFGIPYDGNGASLTSAGTITLSNGVTVTIHPVSGLVERDG
jgi:prepilin-type N-terminal cleavage/methylation domain-containing protein